MFRLWKGQEKKTHDKKTQDMNTEADTHGRKTERCRDNDLTNTGNTDQEKPGKHLIDLSPHFQDLLSWRGRGPGQR